MLIKIDIKSGKLTYAQRMDLGKLIASKPSEKEIFEGILKIMHPDHKIDYSAEEIKLVEEYLEGLKYWVEAETTLLKYEPSAEERKAGYDELNKNTSSFGAVFTIAEKFGQDPDAILKWEYGKVFGILYTDLEKAKFNKRLQDNIVKKGAKKWHK